jgi:hypothetical protein
VVCRGCCCGTEAAHPGVDHGGQVETLRAALPQHVRSRLWTVDCIGSCERSNVVVVRRGEARRWFGEVLEPDVTAALAGWIADGAVGVLPAPVAAREFHPELEPLVTAQAIPRRGDDLAGIVHRTLADGAGGWSIGVEGAVAEHAGTHPSRTIVRKGRAVTSLDDEAGLRLVVSDEMVAFALVGNDAVPVIALFLGVPHRNLERPMRGVRLATDHGALRPADRAATIADLGLGRRVASFAVRTSDPEIVTALRAVEGRGWRGALDEVGDLLIARSPQRVVSSPAGRVEVFTPIPAPDGMSPGGSHTHLRPGTIELGRDLPSPIALPPGFAAVATFHPVAGWKW